MRPNFVYPNPDVDASKIAYDLALVYAHGKCDQLLSLAKQDRETVLSTYPPMSDDEKEMLFVKEEFRKAYEFYMQASSGHYDFE